jgi:hypothetical protein
MELWPFASAFLANATGKDVCARKKAAGNACG